MMKMKDVRAIFERFNKFMEERPELGIQESLNEGDEVAFYDQKSQVIMVLAKNGEEINYKVIAEAYFVAEKVWGQLEE